MTIGVTCPCGRNVFVEEGLAGKHVRCPACKETLFIPTDECGEKAARAYPSAEVRKNYAKSAPETSRKAVILSGTCGGLIVAACFLCYLLIWPGPRKEDRADSPHDN